LVNDLQEREDPILNVRLSLHLGKSEYGILTVLDTEKQKVILQNDPQKYLAYRKKIESELNSRFRFILNGSEEQANARAVKS
jgi:hypothetical protein